MTSKSFLRQGFYLKKNFLTPRECEEILDLISEYRKHHQLPEIYRKLIGRSLHYKVVNGVAIKNHLPKVQEIYLQINQIVNEFNGTPLFPLKNEKVGVNINITPEGGEYRWHYDRNRLTAILYLNEVEGGETEFYPYYRIRSNNSTIQRWLDNLLLNRFIRLLFGKKFIARPEKGAILLMLGNESLHSVKAVKGNKDRINIILAYDDEGKEFAVDKKLNKYLYEEKGNMKSDPNYT